MKRLVIIADHSFVVEAIRMALRQTTGFNLLGYIDGRSPVGPSLAGVRADVVLVDDMEQPETALARIGEVAQVAPDAKIILLTMRMDADWLDEAVASGVESVLCKAVHPVSLGTLVREVANGNIFHRFPRRASVSAIGTSTPLTKREREILGFVAEGTSNSKIARQLWVTEQTVKFHLSNIYRKLGVANRTEAAHYAHVHRLVGSEPQRLAS